MESNVRTDDVLNRLRSLSVVDVSKTLIDSKPYLPTCDAQMSLLATKNSTTYSALTATQKLMADLIVTNLCCIKIVMSAPLPGLEAGIIKIKPISEDTKQKYKQELKAEIDEAISALSWHYESPYSGYLTSDDYVPDKEDLRNLLFTDEDETTVSMWS
jgi:hypothetical protein